MHELGVAFHIVSEVDKIAEANHVKQVKSVTLEIGEVSSVIPVYLQDVWKWAVDNRSKHMKGCELKIIVTRASSYCEDCQKLYHTTEGKKCPYCGSDKTYLVTGNQTNIKDIEVVDE